MATYTAPPRQTGRIIVPDNPRRDTYWLAPASTVLTFVVFILYSTWRAFEGDYFSTFGTVGNHLANAANAIRPHYWSPFYSPYLPDFLPFLKSQRFPIGHFPISAALYVLVFPAAFRLTCYYGRKAYYRAIFSDPGACAVKEAFARHNYTGETRLPTSLFNLHRFAFYAILIVVAFHWKHLADAFTYFRGSDETHPHFGIGLGTLIFAFDTLMLTAYTFSCHSFRHLVGGVINRFSRSPSTQARHGLWAKVTALNNVHGQCFWLSLISVGVTDLYVRLVAAGILNDLRFLNL